MTWEWAALGALALVALGLLAELTALRARTRRDLARARTEAAELRHRLDRLEQERTPPPTPVVRAEREYSITRLGEPGEGEQVPRVEHAVFADTVLREGVVRLGSLAHGVRRALAPATRNRIRFEMRREVKRARKQRRADARTAHREWQARGRAVLDDDLQDTA